MSLRRALAFCLILKTASSLIGCATVVPTLREPAAATSMDLKLVCAGGADTPNVFSFSASEPGKLKNNFSEDGVVTITGVAQVTLRGSGDDSEFEGPVRVMGTRSADARHYSLKVEKGRTEVWLFELPWKGSGIVKRMMMVGGKPMVIRSYEANCMESF